MEVANIKSNLTKFVKKSMKSEKPRFSGWYSGITNDEKRRKAEHSYNNGFLKYWKCLNAETSEKANEVEKYFSEKGTKNSPHKHGAIKTSTFVYIYKINKPKFVGLGMPFSEQDIINQIFGN